MKEELTTIGFEELLTAVIESLSEILKAGMIGYIFTANPVGFGANFQLISLAVVPYTIPTEFLVLLLTLTKKEISLG